MTRIISSSTMFLGVAAILLLNACGSSQNEKASANVDSNAQMAAELDSIANNVPPTQAWNANSIAAEYYKGLLEAAQGQERLGLRFQYANQLLNAGKTEPAIEELHGVIQDFANYGVGLTDQTKLLYEILGVAYLRFGEEQNCCAMHNEKSCFLPIEGEAVHIMREGSEKAIEVYQSILAKYPDDLQTKYLLNLAYMTLGEYPDKVPEEYRISGLGKRNNDPSVPRFRDVAIQSRTDIFGLSGGAALEDFNNDGLLDIMASSYGLSDQLHYLVNNGDGTFTDRTVEAGLSGIVSGLNVLQTDYNNDGFADVFVLRGAWLGTAGNHPNSLLKNNGDNTFTDVTREAGLYSKRPTQTAVWRDFDLDGWVDVFIGNESTKSQTHRCELFMNNGDGTFSERSAQYGINVTSYVKGVASGDIAGDGRPDIYISVINAPNILLKNQSLNGEPHFVDITADAGVGQPLQGFPCWFWDFDQDGMEDIFVSSYDLKGFTNMAEQFAAELTGSKVEAEFPKLYRNTGSSNFEDVSEDFGINKMMYAMGSNYGDINNDGYPDFYIGNGAPDFRMIIPNRMFLNSSGNGFEEVTYDGGFGHIQKGHGVSFGDIDNDGDQDIYCVMGGAVEGDTYQNLLFENPGSEANWISIRLEGTKSNKMSLGAKVKITALDSDGKSIVRYHTVSSGGSFGGSSMRIEAGLGEAVSVESVEVKWPRAGENTEVFNDLKINAAHILVEGSGKARRIEQATFKFGPAI